MSYSGDAKPKIGVIVVTWNSEKYVADLVKSLKKIDYPAKKLRVFFVDNDSRDRSVNLLEKGGYQIVKNNKNEGFAKANNQGVEVALAWGAEYVYCLNPDTEVSPDFLKEALKVFDDEKVGQVQSLTLHEGGKQIQSWGNHLMFLGFGYSGGDGVDISNFSTQGGHASGLQLPTSNFQIGYASGAAMMVRVDVWKEVGGFEEIYESFHEDTDLSLRIRLAGYKVVLAPESHVIHKYTFSSSVKHAYLLERNRFILGLIFFKMPTLVLFLPAFIFMEIGIFFYSFFNSTWQGKLRAYLWLFLHLEKVWGKRMILQRERKLGDKALSRYLIAKIEFQEIMNPILEYVVNPIMSVYWGMIRRIIIW